MSYYTKPITMIPGGIPYRDERVPQKHFPGMEVSTEDQQLTRIVEWRLGNPNVYPPSEEGGKFLNKDWVRDNQLRPYQKNRLGDNPAFFSGGKGAHFVVMEVRTSAPSRACECGATGASPVYCKTCSGARIISWKCNSCGKERGL